MLNKQSPILEFYPFEYKIDLNGKKNLWEGVVLLPFIEEYKLTSAVKKFAKKEKLLPEEKIRNCFGKDVVYINNF